jgi:TonB family protein
MPRYRMLFLGGLCLGLLGCERRPDGTMGLPAQIGSVESTADQPPVAVNPVSPMQYPQALLDQGIEGRVLLRLYVDSAGRLLPDSTRIAESSGYPALDSAALLGAAGLRFSPALRHGQPVAAPFLQPVHFRNPSSRSATP